MAVKGLAVAVVDPRKSDGDGALELDALAVPTTAAPAPRWWKLTGLPSLLNEGGGRLLSAV